MESARYEFSGKSLERNSSYNWKGTSFSM